MTLRHEQRCRRHLHGGRAGADDVARLVPLAGLAERGVPLPIRAKQLFGSLVVAALLALVAVLGLVALGQSNSRGTELRRLQQQGGYEQLLLTDATQLKQVIDLRLGRLYSLNDRPSRSDEPDLPAFDPASYQRGFLSALDQQIGNEYFRLCLDAGAACSSIPICCHPSRTCRSPSTPSRRRCTAKIAEQPVALLPRLRRLRPATGSSSFASSSKVTKWAASLAAKLAVLTRKTQARADALVAADRRSYSQSRDLLIGAGAGSLLLALALGLLLSDSFVVPLRKTQRRLATIAAGDFSGHAGRVEP